MAGFNVNVADVKDYVEMLIPEGKYVVECLSAKEGMTLKDRGKIDLRLKILDTIPSGEDIDLESFLDPIDSSVFGAIYFVKDGDIPRTKNMMIKTLQSYLKHFEVESAVDGVLTGDDFVGCNGGIVIKYEKDDKDDPKSSIRAKVKSACAID